MIYMNNELMSARYSPSLSLMDRRIYNTALFKWQFGETTLTKEDLEEICNAKFSSTVIKKSVSRLNDVTFSLENDRVQNKPIFNSISYNNGVISIEWSEEIKEYIVQIFKIKG